MRLLPRPKETITYVRIEPVNTDISVQRQRFKSQKVHPYSETSCRHLPIFPQLLNALANFVTRSYRVKDRSGTGRVMSSLV